MLSFLRKYQGIVLIIVGASLILPFTFFGTYRAFEGFEKKKDKVLTHALDNSKIMLSDVQQLGLMLGIENSEESLFYREFLESGVADKISAAYSNLLSDEWKTRLDRTKRQRFYVHPAAPTLNARVLWSQFAPGLVDEISSLQGMKELPSDFFTRWSKIYLLQQKCSPEFIRRVLVYQQNQMKNVPPDPRLMSENFALFGYQGAYEWFGRDFFELIAQVVINGAAKAEQSGYRLLNPEVEKDLTRRFVSKEGDQLRSLGVRQNDAVRLWKKALLYTRYLKDKSGETADTRPDQEGLIEVAHVDSYTLPPELQMRTTEDFLAFKLYEKMACQKGKNSLPKAFLKEVDLEKKAPELLMTRYRLRYQELDLQKVASQVLMTQLWEWQIDHWKELRVQFPILKEVSKEGRFQTLEKLDPKLRGSIDEWSRSRIVLEHPEWIEAGFSSALMQEREIMIPHDNKRVDGLSIQQVASFRSSLDKWKEDDLIDFRDQKVFMRIRAVERVPGREVLAFSVAKSKGLLKTDQFLQQLYEEVRIKNPTEFQDEKGKWKPLSAIKEEIIKRSFGDKSHLLQKAMEQKLRDLSQGETTLDFGLWKLNKGTKTIKKNSELFSQAAPGQWSSLLFSVGELSFFHSKEILREKVEKKGLSLQNKEAIGKTADLLLTEISERKALVFPLREG